MKTTYKTRKKNLIIDMREKRALISTLDLSEQEIGNIMVDAKDRMSRGLDMTHIQKALLKRGYDQKLVELRSDDESKAEES